MHKETAETQGRSSGTGHGPPISRLDVLDAMEARGGGFVSALAVAWRKADNDNDARMLKAFGHYYEQYRADLERGRAPGGRGLPMTEGGSAVERGAP